METRKSEINTTFVIKKEEWVISLVRKADSLSQHAFLVLEAIEQGKATIYFMDFIGRNWTTSLPNSDIGSVRYKSYSEPQDKPLIFCCESKMMDLKQGSSISSRSWYINSDDALLLLQSIQAERGKEFPFNILGKQSILTASSATSSSKESGHNCFTWAREKLHSVKDDSIKVQGSNAVEFFNKIVAITGLNVTDVSYLTSASSASGTQQNSPKMN